MCEKEGFYNGGHGKKKTDKLQYPHARKQKRKKKKRIRKQKPEKTEKEKNGRQTCKLAKLAALPHPHTCAYINNATK